jgi:hypothetical protein
MQAKLIIYKYYVIKLQTSKTPSKDFSSKSSFLNVEVNLQRWGSPFRIPDLPVQMHIKIQIRKRR